MAVITESEKHKLAEMLREHIKANKEVFESMTVLEYLEYLDGNK